MLCNKATKWLMLVFMQGLLACSPTTETLTEVRGVNDLKAVWLKRDYGATTSFVYSLYVVDSKASDELKEGEELLRTDSLEGAQTLWTSPTQLSVICLKGHVYKFENVFY